MVVGVKVALRRGCWCEGLCGERSLVWRALVRREQPAVRGCVRRNSWCEGLLGRTHCCEERVTAVRGCVRRVFGLRGSFRLQVRGCGGIEQERDDMWGC